MFIELRSDTFTKPSPGMLQAMLQAPTGDDVFGEDPTVNQLENRVASMFGKEAALFCPSGTMTNQLAIKCHTQAGDEVICDELSHIYQYEGGGIAFNSGCSVRLLQGNRGRLTAGQIEQAINPDDVHKAPSRLVSLENTTNRGGGACYDFNEILSIKEVCKRHQLGFHLDGARLWNAFMAKNETAAQYGQAFDSISVCLSKGMGAPVGSVLTGDTTFIKKARRFRKVLGGGMRQAGILAAAGLYAIDHNLPLLALDHEHAKATATALSQKSWVKEILPVETNILIFSVQGKYTAQQLVNLLAEQQIRCIAISAEQIRFVFHLNISPAMVERLLEAIRLLN